jgi:nucleotide-binding universal stress UspA family protein
MKNILVATDFSGCALNAMDLGLALAEYFDATIHYLTTMDDNRNGEALGFSLLANSAAEKEFLKNVNVLFEEWKKEAAVRNVKIKTICTSGKILPILKDYVHKNHIDFVVIGSHGHSGVKGFFIGSNCQKVVRALHVPVFIIKDQAIKYEFKQVVFASNFKEEEKASFQKFLDFIQKFKPEVIHLVAVNTLNSFAKSTEEMEKNLDEFAQQCKFAKCEKHIYPGLLVEAGIRHFSEKINADLIVISNHNRHPVKRIFSGSTVEALVQNSNLPVLSIDFFEEEILIRKKMY